MLSYGISQATSLYDLNIASQTLVDEHEILTDVLESQIVDKWLDGDDKKIQYLMRNIKDFQGFQGRKYFTLNKSLLTDIIANFLTYFIILVQFKES